MPDETSDAGTVAPDALSVGKDVLPDVLGVGALATTTTALGETNQPGPVISEVIKHYANAPSYHGIPGEQDLAFLLGQLDHKVVIGPGGAAGKSAFGSGVDALTFKPKPNGDVAIFLIDNKSTGLPETQGKSLTFTDKAGQKLESLLERTRAVPDFAEKSLVVDKLAQLVETVRTGGGKAPEDVSFVISNAGGFAREPTEGLQSRFYNATKLIDASGKPLRLDFLDFTSPSELAAREALVDALGRNPRNPTKVDIVEPVVLEPITKVLSGGALGSNPEGALLLGLDVAKSLGSALVIEPLEKRRVDATLDEQKPEITSRLASDPRLGVLLISVNWQSRPNPTEEDLGIQPSTTMVRWEKSFGLTADEAFSVWAAPAKYGEDRSKEQVPKYKAYRYFWFDGKSTTPYKPGTNR